MPGDYDNDGKTDLAVYHQATGNWYILKSSDQNILGGGPQNWGWYQTYPPRVP